MSVADSTDLGKKLLDALGVRRALWSRVVIVCDVGEPARVYVKGFVPDGAVPGIVQAVADAAVSDDGDVTVTPLIAEEIK